MSSVTKIELSMYTLVTSLVNPQELLMKVKLKGQSKTYQTILHHDCNSSQLFNSFEGFSDFIQHVKLPEHSSFNSESKQMVIHGSGTVGKNRKYFEIHRLKLELVEEYNLQSVTQQCLKTADLTPKQLRHFILCIATELSKISQQNKKSEQTMKSHIQQILNEFRVQKNEGIQQRWRKVQQELSSFLERRNEYEKFEQVIEQKLKQINLDFLNQIQKIHHQSTEVYEKLINLQLNVRKFCVQFREVVDGQCKYTGTLVNDLKNGQGTERFSCGDIFEGGFKENLKNGKGTYFYANGNKFEGVWKDGQRQKGTLIQTNGDKLEGVYTYQSNGEVKVQWPNGDKYEGQIKNDKYNGHGILYWANGDRYQGEWKDGEMGGHGAYYWGHGPSKGDRYQGEFKNGKSEGRGTYHWANGQKWKGQWKDEKRHGKGIYYLANGDKYDQYWENGVRKASKKI